MSWDQLKAAGKACSVLWGQALIDLPLPLPLPLTLPLTPTVHVHPEQLAAGGGGATGAGPSGADALLAQYVTWVMPHALLVPVLLVPQRLRVRVAAELGMGVGLG